MANMRSLGLPAGAGLVVLGLSALDVPGPALALAAGGLALACQQLRDRQRGGAATLAGATTRALRNREEQLAQTAHELRTPLAAVSTALELLRDGYAGSADDWQAYLDQASMATQHMAFLINDVVDLAAIESGRLSLHTRPQRVQELMVDVVQVMQLTARARQVELLADETAAELQVQADRGRFLQIVFNLLANAIKFSAPRMAVHLRVLPLDHLVRFEIHDRGPGVADDQRQHLFTRFGRAHAPGTNVGGSGMGLYVSKLLVEHMGGRIGYQPGIDRGSVFWFTLPQAPPASPPRAVAERLEAPA